MDKLFRECGPLNDFALLISYNYLHRSLFAFIYLPTSGKAASLLVHNCSVNRTRRDHGTNSDAS